MKKLDKEFTSNHFRFKRIAREGDIAIYEKTRIGSDYPNWEVVIVQQHTGYEAFGKMIPASEFYPKDRAWGDLGWTCTTKAMAFEKMEELLRNG